MRIEDGGFMEKLIVRPTRITPLIYFDPNRGLLELRGKSSPENSIQFYSNLIRDLEEFGRNGKQNLIANFKFEYFNTSSSKCLFDIFRKLNIVKENGFDLSINWYYEEDDEDMLEAGEDYADLLGIEFNYVETQFD
ncbi:protein of unknown function [Reichenbachiella faecimaris]|uniref:SiaC family regulatory phosphoprotein domain-containing protein n=2 Tax=Reichenbachiella TaxID=156993 RepID=A0A1W2G6G4_REIFA|nr:DUF1987 domain-containing protein [Reichenbachiella faecimaris]SMD32267.1 protein of unknown function [Reichenbachiella faecimaris]